MQRELHGYYCFNNRECTLYSKTAVYIPHKVVKIDEQRWQMNTIMNTIMTTADHLKNHLIISNFFQIFKRTTLKSNDLLTVRFQLRTYIYQSFEMSSLLN